MSHATMTVMPSAAMTPSERTISQGTAKRLLKPSYTYLESGPEAGRFHPIQLKRADLLSFYYCSGYDLRDRGQRYTSVDVAGVGCTG
jgi:hypothetical protein